LTYIQEMDIRDTPIRFDVVSLGPRGTRHYRNAFYAGGNYYY
jgi:Holliday junction resolvase-like predicted endonuclease